MTLRKDKLEEFAGPPELGELLEEYRRCLDRRGTFDRRQKLNRDARFQYWEGQSDDGRKWTPKGNDTEVRPWKGASDSRPHLVDTFVREDVAKLTMVRGRAKILVSGTEANDAEFGTRLTQLLRWRHTQMTERRRETRLAANWLLERGLVVIGCWWNKQTALGYEELDMETVQTRAQMAGKFLQSGNLPEGFDEETLLKPILFPEMILDPERIDEAAAFFQEYYKDVKAADARKAITDLRTQGHARFPRPYVRVDRPCIGARAFGEEVFLPEEATSIETARALYEAELLREATLRERVISHGWDKAWVDEVIETQRGALTSNLNRAAQSRWTARTSGLTTIDTSKLFEIIHAYRRLADEAGVIGIYYTCFHAGMTGKKSRRRREFAYGYHGLLNYDHGELPYTLFSLEDRSRVIDDSRGYGERINTHQSVVKGVWDQNIDAASISTVRPYFYPPDSPPEQWGPGVGIGTRQPDRYGFFPGLEYNPLSEKVEQMVTRGADRYMGRPLPEGSNALEAQAMQQEMADNWMAGWARVDTQQLKLEQQFAPDVIYYRVVGDEQAHPLHATRDEIQGQFDVSISYNTSMMNVEYVKMVFDFVSQAMQWGSGRIDVDKLTEFGFDLMDPNLAGRVLKPAQEAAAEEQDDERNVLNSLLNGVGVDVRPGQAYELRLNWLTQELQRNKRLEKAYSEDESVKEAIEQRLQQLRHQVEQRTTNPQAGRLGGTPAAARGQ